MISSMRINKFRLTKHSNQHSIKQSKRPMSLSIRFSMTQLSIIKFRYPKRKWKILQSYRLITLHILPRITLLKERNIIGAIISKTILIGIILINQILLIFQVKDPKKIINILASNLILRLTFKRISNTYPTLWKAKINKGRYSPNYNLLNKKLRLTKVFCTF